jgi:hypothetical protein
MARLWLPSCHQQGRPTSNAVQFPLVENLEKSICPILDRKICNSLKRGKVLNYVQECHENYAGVSVAQNQTIERGYLQIYRLLFDCRSGPGLSCPTVRILSARPRLVVC